MECSTTDTATTPARPAVRVYGFTEAEACAHLRALLARGYRPRMRRIEGFSARFRLVVPLPQPGNAPGVAAIVSWPEEVARFLAGVSAVDGGAPEIGCGV